MPNKEKNRQGQPGGQPSGQPADQPQQFGREQGADIPEHLRRQGEQGMGDVSGGMGGETPEEDLRNV